MRALAIVAAFIIQAGLVAHASPIGAQSRGSVTLDIPSGDASVRGRFFPAQGGTPRATVLIVPGWGGDTLDASGIGAALSARRINVLLINFRGVQQSAGRFTYDNALEDIGSALRWLRTPEQRIRFGPEGCAHACANTERDTAPPRKPEGCAHACANTERDPAPPRKPHGCVHARANTERDVAPPRNAHQRARTRTYTEPDTAPPRTRR